MNRDIFRWTLWTQFRVTSTCTGWTTWFDGTDCQSFLLTGGGNDDDDRQYYHCFHSQLHDEREGPVLDDDGHVHCESSSGWENPLQGDADEGGGADGAGGQGGGDDVGANADEGGAVADGADDHADSGNLGWSSLM